MQNTGFAVRRGVPFRCGPDERELSLGDALRRGKELTLFPDGPREIRLLSVHLKSGCSSPAAHRPGQGLPRPRPPGAPAGGVDRRPGTGGETASQCWATSIGTCSRRSRRVHTPESQQPLGGDLRRRARPKPSLRNAAAGEAFRNCVPGQGYRAYIDNIVLSRTLAAEAIPGSFARLTYSAADARHARLSDHCPVSIRVKIEQKVAPAG